MRRQRAILEVRGDIGDGDTRMLPDNAAGMLIHERTSRADGEANSEVTADLPAVDLTKFLISLRLRSPCSPLNNVDERYLVAQLGRVLGYSWSGICRVDHPDRIVGRG